MNKQSIINIVLGLGVALVLILQITGSNSSQEPESKPAEKPKKEKAEGDGTSSTLSVGYIRTDSLLTKYERHKDLQAQLEKKVKSLEREWERKMGVFQENLKVLEEEAANMNQQQLQMAQQELEMKQQELMAYRERKTQEVMREEQELNASLFEEVYDAIDVIKERLGLDMIFMWDIGGSLVWADESFDITNEMAEELNRMVKKEEETKGKSKK
ncbi:MAG: OmpH family outer membrane protein [Cryomorphaceae bacterium]|nr:OmpH family outer membrane protein [Cryomorphaceae bacterium]